MRSPYTLLQEELNKDPWKIFVCCIFCNLTKRKSSEPYFWEVLKRWPDPESLSKADTGELENLIQPLGLSKRRTKTLKKMSEGYISTDWKDNPKSLYGIGKYAHDAYRIFVLDEWKDVEPTDGALKNYLSWRKSDEYICAR
jgi:methyl-CpG-binding domain protein 4